VANITLSIDDALLQEASIDADPGVSAPRLPKEMRQEMHELHSKQDRTP
jgi:hypothetical protein